MQEEYMLEESAERSTAVGPVERVLDLLTCFDVKRSGVSLTELAQQAHLAPSTASRLLKVLEQYGFIRRGPDRLYHLGPQIMQLGLIALRDMSLYEIAKPHLKILAEESEESVQLGIVRGSNVLYIDQVASPRLIQATPWLGRTIPMAETAIGAALQGQVGATGYIATRQTVEPDVSSVAAPIFDLTNTIIAAINVIGPTYRISDTRLAEIGMLVAEHARQISLKLGASTVLS